MPLRVRLSHLFSPPNAIPITTLARVGFLPADLSGAGFEYRRTWTSFCGEVLQDLPQCLQVFEHIIHQDHVVNTGFKFDLHNRTNLHPRLRNDFRVPSRSRRQFIALRAPTQFARSLQQRSQPNSTSNDRPVWRKRSRHRTFPTGLRVCGGSLRRATPCRCAVTSIRRTCLTVPQSTRLAPFGPSRNRSK